MNQQKESPSFEEVKDALKIISKYCFKTELEDCPENCKIHQLLGGCPSGIFIPAPEDWEIE